MCVVHDFQLLFLDVNKGVARHCVSLLHLMSISLSRLPFSVTTVPRYLTSETSYIFVLSICIFNCLGILLIVMTSVFYKYGRPERKIQRLLKETNKRTTKGKKTGLHIIAGKSAQCTYKKGSLSRIMN